MCTHILCCGPLRVGGANHRPPPSAAIDCPRPSPIPILGQHPQSSFLPLLYPAARASFLSYRFQRPCRPEVSKTSPFCELIFHTLPRCIASARRETDPSPECQSDPGSFVVRSVFLLRMIEWQINRHSMERHFHQKALERLSLSSLRARGEASSRNIRRSSCIYIYISKIYISLCVRESTYI